MAKLGSEFRKIWPLMTNGELPDWKFALPL